MKKTKLVLLFMAIFYFVACVLPQFQSDIKKREEKATLTKVESDEEEEEQEEQKRVYYGFATKKDENITKVEVSEIEEYENVTMQYGSDYFYHKLDEEAKTLYKAYIYAMENGYQYVYIDESLFFWTFSAVDRALYYLSYDSPLLEQNLRYDVDYLTEHREDDSFGTCVRVNNFQKKFWEKKMEAVDKAKKIVKKLPDNLSEKKKAQKLFSYLAKDSEYQKYSHAKDNAVRYYLYDALFKKNSHCDGYTNALSLLYNLAGIECIEKSHTSIVKEGHTWNCAKIGGQWYNVDVIGVLGKEGKEKEILEGRYLGFSDELQCYVVDHEELYPKCQANLSGVQVRRAKKIVGEEFYKKVLKELRKSGGKYMVLVNKKKYDNEELESQMQKIANAIHGTVYWITEDVNKEKKLLILYR